MSTVLGIFLHAIRGFCAASFYLLKQLRVSQLTPKSFTTTAIYFYDLKLLSKIAKVLGEDSEHQRLAEWADRVKSSFNNKFFNKRQTSAIATRSQISMAMPWSVGLVDPEYQDIVIIKIK